MPVMNKKEMQEMKYSPDVESYWRRRAEIAEKHLKKTEEQYDLLLRKVIGVADWGQDNGGNGSSH